MGTGLSDVGERSWDSGGDGDAEEEEEDEGCDSAAGGTAVMGTSGGVGTASGAGRTRHILERTRQARENGCKSARKHENG